MGQITGFPIETADSSISSTQMISLLTKLNAPTTLFSGTLSAGNSATVSNLINYTLLIVMFTTQATPVLAVKYGGVIRAVGGMSSDGNLVSYQINMNYTGNTVTLVDASSILHSKSAGHGINASGLTVNTIIGLL